MGLQTVGKAQVRGCLEDMWGSEMEGVEVVCRHALAALHAASHAVLAKCVLDPTSPPGFASVSRAS